MNEKKDLGEARKKLGEKNIGDTPTNKVLLRAGANLLEAGITARIQGTALP